MKIAIVSTIYSADSGGAIGILTECQTKDLLSLGNEIYIFTLGKKDGWLEKSPLKIFTTKNTDLPWFLRSYLCLRNPKIEKQFKQFLENTKPDVVHFHGMYHQLPYYLIKIAKNFQARTVITLHDVMIISPQKLHHFIKKDLTITDAKKYKISFFELLKQNGKAFNPLRNYLIRRYLNYADTILSVSEELKTALSVNKIKNIQVLHNGIKSEEWVVEESKISEFRTRYGLVNKYVIFISGRLSGAKGVKETLLMLKEVIKNHSNTVLFLACNQDLYSQNILDLATKIGVEKNLIFSGWLNREQIKVAYASSDIVLVPSVVFDSFPTVNLEAMASKKPVIGTCFGGTKEAITDGVNGYIVNPYLTKLFAEKVIYLINNPDIAKNMGQMGRKIVTDSFSQKKHIEKLIKIYEK